MNESICQRCARRVEEGTGKFREMKTGTVGDKALRQRVLVCSDCAGKMDNDQVITIIAGLALFLVVLYLLAHH